MRRIVYWLVAAGVIPGALWSAEIAEATREADKAAAREVSSEADQWAASHKEAAPSPVKPKAAEEAVQKDLQEIPQPEAPAAPPAEPEKPAEPAAKVSQAGLNEMTGKLLSIDTDPKVLRITVAGGFNVEFTYDSKTVMINGGKPVSASDISYGDELVVRYAGKELKAVEVDRINKGPRLNLQ